VQNQPAEKSQPSLLASSAVKPDEISTRPTQAEKTSVKKLPELNASLTKKPEINTPKKGVTTVSAASTKQDRKIAANSTASTTQVTIGAGDTLDGLARRYKISSAELRKLNPQINNQGVIKADQKIRVPAPAPPKDPKGRRLALLKQTH
jgi:LysM repeat protein